MICVMVRSVLGECVHSDWSTHLKNQSNAINNWEKLLVVVSVEASVKDTEIQKYVTRNCEKRRKVPVVPQSKHVQR